MVWTHLVRHKVATHGPLWWTTIGAAQNLDASGSTLFAPVAQTQGWRNGVLLSGGVDIPSPSHGGLFVDDSGALWLLGRTTSPLGIGRWNATTHQIEKVFNTDPINIGGALDLASDGSGGLYVVSGFGVLAHWTGGSTAATVYSGTISSGYSPYQLKTLTPLIDGFGRHYFSGDAYLPINLEQFVGNGISYSRNWWFGYPANIFVHNGTWWILARGIWRWDIGSGNSLGVDVLWKLISGDPTDPVNYLCEYKFSSADLNGLSPGTDSLLGTPFGAVLEHFAGATYFVAPYIGASLGSTAIYVLESGSDSCPVSKGEITGEKIGGIAALDGNLYSTGLAGGNTLNVYQLSGGTWTLVAAHTFSVSIFNIVPVMLRGVEHELWIWPVQKLAGGQIVLSWDGFSFTEHTVFPVESSSLYPRLWYSPY